MKTQIITWLCCWCFSYLGLSQSITEIQYFFNTDTGFGGATTISANPNSGNLTQTLNISIGTLTGFNSLYFRVKDDQNVWSMYEKRVFYVADFMLVTGATNITDAEYFFNNDDMGFGMNTAININPDAPNISHTEAIVLPSSLTGFNSLYIRVKDDLDVWSMYEKRVFYVTDFMPTAGATNITDAEYFFNNDDMGFGMNTAININPDAPNISHTEAIMLPSTLTGFNSLYIRVKDDLGVWSLYEKRIFYVKDNVVLNVPSITGAEYFYNTDPGFGNGVAASITPTGNPDEYTIDLENAGISCDIHDFYIRLQNSDGTWGLYDYTLGFEIYDNADPTIVVFPNITAELDSSGQASITLVDVDNGTYDDCELVSVALNQAQFDYTCSDLGVNSVTITAEDAEAKVSNQNVDITVVDLINPLAAAKNIAVQLDANGNASITGSQVDNGSTDNCSVTNFSLDISSFDCNDLGANIVTLTAIDQSGNSSTNAPTATVMVEDNTNPSVITQNINVQLDATGNASITANDIDNGSTDNCTISSRSLDVSTFTCANLGANVVTLTVTDQSGNSNNDTATVTVQDIIQPTVTTQNITVQLDGSGNASIIPTDVDNGSTDNCSITNRSLDVSSFTCSNLGANVVTLTVTDQSGNSNNDTAMVKVEDMVDPVAIGKDIMVDLDGNPSVIITANDVDNGSSDNCGFSLSIDEDTFTMEGVYPVELTATDGSGNTHSITVMVTVEDTSLSTDEFKISAKNIKLHPVPTDDNLYITTRLLIETITIYDMLGQKVRTINYNKNRIDISQLSTGLYFLQFRIEHQSVIKRMIKN